MRTFLGQGSERETGLALDVMVQGDGFFVVQTDEGVRYTRDGHFDRDAEGRLITADGAFVLDENGEQITLTTNNVRIRMNGDVIQLISTDIPQADGSVFVDVNEEPVAKLQLVNLQADDLIRAGQSKFMVGDGSPVTPVDMDGGRTFLIQGSLEEANVNVGQTATQMYSVARTFSSSQRVFSEINKTLDTAVTDLGRM